MKQKIVIGVACLMMMGIVSLPIHAEDATTAISATVPSTYQLSIPAKTSIPFNATSTPLQGNLKVVGNVSNGQSVEVSVTAKYFENKPEKSTLPYKLMTGNDEFITKTWDETQLRDGSTTIPLRIQIALADWNKAQAGEYSGIIIFTATLK